MTESPRIHQERRPASGANAVTVTFIHGVGDRGEVWNDVIGLLPANFDVITYDLRGHGRSDKPPGPYELSDFVDDHLRVLAAAGVERTHLVGGSLGGLIAQAIAIAHPETVDALVLMNSIAGRSDEERERVWTRFELAHSASEGEWPTVDPARWFSPEFLAQSPARVDEHMGRLRDNDHAAYVAAYRVLAANDLADSLHLIRNRTLVVTGEGDVGSPPHMSELMGQRIPDAEVVILQGQKHVPWTEIPERVAHLISDFIGAGSPSTTAA